MNSSELKRRAVSVHNALAHNNGGEEIIFLYLAFVCLALLFGMFPLELIGLEECLPNAVEQFTGQWGADFQAFVDAHRWILYPGEYSSWYWILCGIICDLWFISLAIFLCLRFPLLIRLQKMTKHRSEFSISHPATIFLGTIRGQKVNLTDVPNVYGPELGSGSVKPVVSLLGDALNVHYEAAERMVLDSPEALKFLSEWTERGERLVVKAPGKLWRRMSFISPFILPTAYYAILTWVYLAHCQ